MTRSRFPLQVHQDGSWGGINYAPGPACTGNHGLVQAVEKALRFVSPLVGVDCAKPGNWWYWQIAMPGELGETLLLLEGQLRPSTAADAEATMRYLLMEDAIDASRPSQAGYWHRTPLPSPGGNR